MNLAFPLCRQPRHEDRVRHAIGTCVSLVLERVPAADLVAVVLTGSFARGEGSVLPMGRVLKVLGDFEFFVVLTRRAASPAVRRVMATWGAEATLRLAGLGVHSEVDFGLVSADFFRRRARPSIFVYDLREHGKVLWGRAGVLEEIRAFASEAIPPEDALYLAFNRTIEQLDAHERLARLPPDQLVDAAYQQTKLVLDLAGSALAFAGRHTPLYRRRPGAFARLVTETPSLEARLPAGFQAALAEAASAKLDPGAHFASPPVGPVEEERERLRGAIVGSVPVVAGLLRWELAQLGGRDGELEDLLDRWLTTPTYRRRVWDWAKLVLNPLPAPLPVSHARAGRLFFTSTPRALLYAAGTLAYLALHQPRRDVTAPARLLPLPRGIRLDDPADLRRAVVALWRWGVRNT
jgi:hypothetical protein